MGQGSPQIFAACLLFPSPPTHPPFETQRASPPPLLVHNRFIFGESAPHPRPTVEQPSDPRCLDAWCFEAAAKGTRGPWSCGSFGAWLGAGAGAGGGLCARLAARSPRRVCRPLRFHSDSLEHKDPRCHKRSCRPVQTAGPALLRRPRGGRRTTGLAGRESRRLRPCAHFPGRKPH